MYDAGSKDGLKLKNIPPPSSPAAAAAEIPPLAAVALPPPPGPGLRPRPVVELADPTSLFIRFMAALKSDITS
jgi:hypothetical protein